MKRGIIAVLFLSCWLLLPVCPAEAARKYQHQPFADKSCESCHTSAKPGGADLSAQPPELCFQCHDQFSGKYQHSPSSVGACLFCHNPHEADQARLLNEPAASLCFQCHDQFEREMNREGNAVHAPAQDDCTACHSPHASDISTKLLKKDIGGLCTDCHAKEGVPQPADFDRVTNKHQPVTTGQKCVTCHTPHASPLGAYLLAEPMDLCLTCHGEDMPGKDGKILPGMRRLLKENPYHHGPIKEKNCSGCHNPHGSDFYRILRAEYPDGFYVDGYGRDKFQLCFTCHKAEAMEVKETTTLTSFRNGSRNLHFLHVNRDKGRSCRACHATHASNQPNHLRESVPFGKSNWPLKLQYKVEYSNPATGEPCTEPSASCVQSGGSCVACHARLTYNYLKK